MTPTERLRRNLEQIWSSDTSATPNQWGWLRPSVGQCAVTALVVQDDFGGDLLRAVVCGESHYWNRLPDGTEVDLTRDQFPVWISDGEVEERTREQVLSHPETERRYRILLGRLAARRLGE